MKRRWRLGVLGTLVFVLAIGGCSRANLDAIRRAPTVDASTVDASTIDARSIDASTIDARSIDASTIDASTIDARSIDARTIDGNAIDGTTIDGNTIDGNTVAVTCPSPVLKTGDTTATVQIGAANRSYLLHVPSKYDGSRRTPLVVDFHAIGGSASFERSMSPYPAVTDPEGVVMAFPTGLSGPLGAAWNVGPCCVPADVDDVAFVKAMITQIQTKACIDPKRVYAVGVSMGGGMVNTLACRAADVFAAAAPAAFDLLEDNVADCKPSRPITVISFRGTEDTLVPYAGGYSSFVSGMPVTFLGAQDTFKKWAELDRCTGSPSAENSNGCATYSNCQGGVEVVLCTKQGGGNEAGIPSISWPLLKNHPMP
jgi:polyhydroxybutyrate depolymerase